MNSGPERSEQLSAEQMIDILRQLFEESPGLSLVVFSGGESMLLGEDLYRAIRFAKDQGRATRLVTNAYWASTPERATQVVAELRAAGLEQLNISTDDQHLPFISLQRVRNAYAASMATDFTDVCIAHCHGPESWLTPEAVNQELEGGKMPIRFGGTGNEMPYYPESQDGRPRILLSNPALQSLGRGKEQLVSSETVATTGDLLAHEYYDHGCGSAVRSLAISPQGHVLSCCGFELEGNPVLDYGPTAERSVAELLDIADQDVLTNLIAWLGPARIKAILEERWPDEVSFKGAYTGYCDVCQDLVGNEQNRSALFRHQAAFVEALLEYRDHLREAIRPDAHTGS
jgi:hypothetical protein